MRIVYMGTPDFAVPALEKLAACAEHAVAGVFTQPDKPQGRKMILTPPDVKVCAQKLGIPVFQPASMKSEEALDSLKELNPDVIVVNIHGSLLPKYRGAAPIQQAVLDGEAVTGVTTMLMDVGLDTGDILLTAETPIGENETAGELFDRLAILGGELIIETLDKLERGGITPVKQDESLATHTSKIDKSRCPLDFTKPAAQLHNQIRGLSPWPVATAQIGGRRLKIHSSRLSDLSGKPGTVLSVKPFVVACGEGALEITELQPEGKKRMTAEAYLLGHPLNIGDTI